MADESGDDRYETGPTIWELGGRRDGADFPLRVEVAERARGCGDARTDFEERPAICERRALGEQREGLEMGDTVKVLNVWADEQGVSHLREIEFDLKSVPPGGALSDPIKTTNLWFRTTPEKQDFDWHPAPRRQLVISLSGGVAEITASDGESRLVKPGEIVLVEDTFGQGHKTKAFDGLPRLGVFIALAD